MNELFGRIGQTVSEASLSREILEACLNALLYFT